MFQACLGRTCESLAASQLQTPGATPFGFGGFVGSSAVRERGFFGASIRHPSRFQIFDMIL